MSKQYTDFGLDRNPFQESAATEEIIEKYQLVGRTDQEERLKQFVRDALQNPTQMKRGMIIGDYGTGKTHHLLTLRNEIRDGYTIEGERRTGLAAYVGELRPAIRLWYENIVDEFIDQAKADGKSEFVEQLEALRDVEPDESVDPGYEYGKLVENIEEALSEIGYRARNDHGYGAIFILSDEAEKLASEDTSARNARKFTDSLRDITDDLSGSGLHFLLGFSQKAKTRLAGAVDEDDNRVLGAALFSRFLAEERPIRLGNLTVDDIERLLIDRMDHHRVDDHLEERLDPIAKETIPVVKDVTGGNPRAILSVYNDAFEYARERELDQIAGKAVFYAIFDKSSLLSDDELLSKDAFNNLLAAIRRQNDSSAEDFDRLKHRLFAEDEPIPKRSFTESNPDELTSAITVGNEELRVLERTQEHGQYYYWLHEDIKDYVFGSAGLSDTSQVEPFDNRVTAKPLKHQPTLARGFARTFTALPNARATGESIQVTDGDQEYQAWFVEYNPGPGYRSITLAVTVVGIVSIPGGIYELLFEALDDGADFGIILTDGQQRSGEANKYLSELNDKQKYLLENRILEDSFTLGTDQLDDMIYGKLYAMGDIDADVDSDVFDQEDLIESIGFEDTIEESIEELVLPYPDQSGKKIIDFLRINNKQTFNLKDIKDELDVNIDGDKMSNYRDQGLVTKDSYSWTYPDLETDDPPWKVVYRKIKTDGPLSVVDLKEHLEREYIMHCPPGAERDMVQWYLNHLVQQQYIEDTRQNGDIVYEEKDIGDRYEGAKEKATGTRDRAESLINKADSLSVNDLNEYRKRLEDVDNRITANQTLDPTPDNLAEIEKAGEEAASLVDDLESTINKQKEALEEQVTNLNRRLGDLKDEMSEKSTKYADEDEIVSVAEPWQAIDDFERWIQSVEEEIDELELLLEEDEYQAIVPKLGNAEQELEKAEERFEDFVGQRGEIERELEALYDRLSQLKDAITEISEENDAHSELTTSAGKVEERFESIESDINARDLEEATEKLDQADKRLSDLLKQATELRDREQSLRKELEALVEEAESELDEEEQRLVAKINEHIANGDFVQARSHLNDLEGLIVDEGPTIEERFLEAVDEYDGSVNRIVQNTDFSRSQVFTYIQKFQDNEISDVRIITTE